MAQQSGADDRIIADATISRRGDQGLLTVVLHYIGTGDLREHEVRAHYVRSMAIAGPLHDDQDSVYRIRTG